SAMMTVSCIEGATFALGCYYFCHEHTSATESGKPAAAARPRPGWHGSTRKKGLTKAMKIPFVDLSTQHEHLVDELLADYRQLLERCDFIGGEAVQQFEQQFATMMGAQHCIGLNSGTDALVLALRAIGVGPGDEVVVPAFTFVATAEAITAVGAKPVFVDVREETMNINPELIPDAITAETRAILPVHLFGWASEMSLIHEIAESIGLVVLEDAAQACGTKIGKQYCGAMSTAGCFSFYPSKNLGGTGDGGCILTNDEELAHIIRLMHDHGKDESGAFQIAGCNSRLDTIQAQYLLRRLEDFEDSLLDRVENARFYEQKLKDTGIVLPPVLDDGSHTYNYYTVRLRERDQLRSYLQERGIGSAVYYAQPLPYEPCYAHLGYQEGDFPVVEAASKQALSLPIYPGLTKRQLEAICGTVREFMEKLAPVH
ncbi:DegT/DnrJ/EryC1/StrS family aminotransferase, partial [Candidatus Sumerlaeota bacterium]